MPDCKKLPLIHGAVADIKVDYPKEATEGITKLFGKKSATDLFTAFNSTLGSTMGAGNMALGHVVQLNTVGPIWHDQAYPFGLTTFAFHPDKTKVSNAEVHTLMVKQQQDHGNQQLDPSDVKIMLNMVRGRTDESFSSHVGRRQ